MTATLELQGPSDRFTVCPSCRRDVRVTDDELRIGKSFCAACGHRFVVTERLVGDAPYRSLVTVMTEGGRPRDARVIVREGGAIALLAPPGHGSGSLISLLGTASLILNIIYSGWFTPWPFLLLYFVYGDFRRPWTGRDGKRLRIERRGDSRVFRSGPLGLHRQRVPIGEITDISVSSTASALVRFALRDGESVDVRVGWLVGSETVAWLQGQLTEMAARPAAAQLEPPK